MRKLCSVSLLANYRDIESHVFTQGSDRGERMRQNFNLHFAVISRHWNTCLLLLARRRKAKNGGTRGQVVTLQFP